MFILVYLVIFLIVIAFLALQSLSVYRLMGNLQGSIDLFSELSNGKVERTGDKALACGWVKWINGIFPEEKSNYSGAWTRDDVGKKFEQWINSDSNLHVLQRTAIAAPMIGVLITVFAFWNVDLSKAVQGATVLSEQNAPASTNDDGEKTPESQNKIQFIMRAIRPLFFGVAIGAGLALLNQGMLYFANERMNILRQEAMGWFDIDIWCEITSQHEQALDRASQSLIDMTGSISEVSDQHISVAASMEQSMHHIDVAGKKLTATLDGFAAQLQKLPNDLSSISELVGTTGKLVHDLTTSAKETAVTLKETSHAWKVAIQEEFKPSIDQHKTVVNEFAQHMGTLTETLKAIDGFSQVLTEQGRKIEQSVARQSQSSTSLLESIRDQVLPTNAKLEATATTMSGAADTFSAGIQKFLEPASRSLAELNEILGKLNTTADKFGELTDIQEKLTPMLDGLKEAANVAREVAKLPEIMQCSLKEVVMQVDEFSQRALRVEAERAIELYMDVIKQIGGNSDVRRGPR